MTTLDPGASEVLTQGLRLRPLSTAFLASSAAPIMTDGLEVLVHEVIDAMVTAPWSRVKALPSSRVTSIGLRAGPPSFGAAERWLSGAGEPLIWPWYAGTSEAGND